MDLVMGCPDAKCIVSHSVNVASFKTNTATDLSKQEESAISLNIESIKNDLDMKVKTQFDKKNYLQTQMWAIEKNLKNL
jgi:hypothetical protein